MSRAFDLRKPCACGSTAGRIENKNGQTCIYCAECDKYQYNAPRAEVDRYRQSVVDDLAAFLNARLDEDEMGAAAATKGPWVWDAPRGYPQQVSNSQAILIAETYAGPDAPAYDIEHITRHNPARVLAEVEAKRRMLAEHGSGSDPCDAHDAEFRTIPCTTLLLLALPYADHRDYREDWKP